MRVVFDKESVAKYEFVNGHKPRGVAMWFFEAVYHDGKGAYTTDTYISRTLPYAAAKKEAMSEFRAKAPAAAVECIVSVAQ